MLSTSKMFNTQVITFPPPPKHARWIGAILHSAGDLPDCLIYKIIEKVALISAFIGRGGKRYDLVEPNCNYYNYNVSDNMKFCYFLRKL